jgi:ABC-type glycerol-3-phosphate transport system permease component
MAQSLPTSVAGPRYRAWSNSLVRATNGALRALQYLLLALVTFVMALPLIWMILSALKPDTETSSYPPTLLPVHPTLVNFGTLFKISPFAAFYANSVIAAGTAAVLTIVVSSLAAYAITRFRHRVFEALAGLGLIAYMLPSILVVVPVVEIARALHGTDSVPAIAMLYTAYFTPFGLWLLRSYFAGIPLELEEAAMVDGATRFTAFRRVVLPQALPGIIATAIFTFSVAWNEYLYASVLLYSPQHQTLSAGLAVFLIGQLDSYSWGVLMAGGTLMTVPVIIMFIFLQRWLVAGWGEGAIKG